MASQASGDPIPTPDLPAGNFSDWLEAAREAQRTRKDSPVPCGDCRGCCTSSYFILIAPDETRTLASIPKPLLFPAPGMPKGYRLLGFRENGHCPMLVDNACSIYAHRPRTCRDYDCRVFPASGIPVEEGKPAIARQVARWDFGFPSGRDRECLEAVRAAARFLRTHREAFPKGFVPGLATQQAVMAIRAYRVFLDPATRTGPGMDPARVRAIADAMVSACGEFR